MKKTKQERKEAKHKKNLLLAEYKITHDWKQDIIADLRSYRPTVGFCKVCGIHYQLFKINPTPCHNKQDNNLT